MYANEVRNWIYNDDGNFLGVDETNGDISGTTNYTFTVDGMIDTVVNVNKGDPYHNNDDTIITTNYASNTTSGKWLNMPYKTETKDTINTGDDALISRKITYYDGSPTEGVVTSGVITRDQAWDSNDNNDPVTNYTYDAKGNVASIQSYTVTNSNGLMTNIETKYDNLESGISKWTKKTLPNGLEEIKMLDIYGRLKKKIDFYGDTQVLTYDDYNRVISITENIEGVDTVTKSFEYSKDGDYFMVEASYLDNAGGDNYIHAQYFKDSLGREIQTKREGVVNGVKVWIVSGKPEFDVMSRVVATGSESTADYSNNGYINTGMADPVTNFTYDNFGRLAETELASGLIISTDYDLIIDNDPYTRILSSVTTSNNEGHESIVYKDMSDAEVRTTALKDDNSYATTRFQYNLHGWGKVIQSNGNEGEKQFDSLGRLIWMISPDAGKYEYIYNNKGLVNQVNDYGKDLANPRSIYYSYDALNRITNINYTGTDNDINYEYYGIGAGVDKYAQASIKKIKKGDVNSPYYSVAYNYDQLWIDENKTIDGTDYLTKYIYDVQARIKTVQYPDGENVNYSYNEGGYLNHVEGNQVYIDEIKYDEFGQRSYLKYGNGSEMTYEYDPTTRLLDKFTTKDASGNEILRYDYDFNLSGNISSITDTPGGSVTKSTQTYQYDNMNRLVNAIGSYSPENKSYNESYTFDDNNRMLEKSVTRDGQITNYTYSYLNQTHAVSNISINDGEKNINFSYDDYGNMTRKETFAGSTSLEHMNFIYDETNKIKAIDDGTINLEFKYDNKGQRIKKVLEDSNNVVISSTTYVTNFYTISNGRIDKHISDGKYIIASKIGNTADGIKYYHSNHIGSTAALTDNEGTKFQSYLFTPYGETWVKEDNPDNTDITRLFTGQEFDQETGLYYMGARYYDPSIGIFLTPDPVMDGLNHYSYCDGNPIMFNDPTGFRKNPFNTFINVISSLINLITKKNDSSDVTPTEKENKSHTIDPLVQKDDTSKYGYECQKFAVTNEILDTGAKVNSDKSRENVMNDLKKTDYNVESVTDTVNKLFSEDVIVSTKRITSEEAQDIIKNGGLKENERLVLQFTQQDYWGPKRDGTERSGYHWVGYDNYKDDTLTTNDPYLGMTLPSGGRRSGNVKPEDIVKAVIVTVEKKTENPSTPASPPSSSNSICVICTELYRQRLLEFNIYKADQEFGKYLRRTNPDVIKGYHFLAKPIVKQMRKSKTITNIVRVIATPWANEMAYQMGYREKGDFAGKIIMSIGVFICKITGNFIANPAIGLFRLVMILLLIASVIIMIKRRKTLLWGNDNDFLYRYIE